MHKIINSLRANLYSIFSYYIVFISVAIFIIMFFSTKLFAGIGFNYTDTINNVFIGPNNLSENFVMLMMWILLNIIIVIICCNFFYKELQMRGMYVITKLKSKVKYILSIILTNYILCILYYLIGFIVIFIMYKATSNCDSNYVLTNYSVIEVWFLLINQSFLLVNISMFVVLITKNHTNGFLATIIIMISSVLLGAQYPEIDKFLPASQGILIKHYLNGYSLIWSIIYLFIFSAIVIAMIYFIWKKRDLYNLINN